MSKHLILPNEKSLSFSAINKIDDLEHHWKELINFIDKGNTFLTEIHANVSLNVNEAVKSSILTAILYNPRIKSITIEGVLDRQTANWIAKFRRMESLERLEFRGFITVPDKRYERAIAYMLQTNANLQELSLYALYSDTTERFLKALTQNLRPDFALRKLSVQYCSTTYKCFDAIGNILESHPSLDSLEVLERRNEIGNMAARRIAHGIEHSTSLTRISIDARRLSKEAGKHLLSSLLTKTSLKAVSVGSLRCNVGRLAAKVLEANPSLEEFSIRRRSYSQRSDEDLDITALGQVVASSRHLTALSLAGYNMSTADIKILCNSLQENGAIESVGLCGNTINEEGIHLICDLISNTSSLKRLNLSRNRLTGSTIELLCQAMASNESIEDLNLYWNSLSEKDATFIGKMLLKNISLKKLRLWRVEIPGESCIRALIEGVKAHPSITDVGLLLNNLPPSSDPVLFRQELDYYLELNRGPKRILSHETVLPMGVWPLVLRRADIYGRTRSKPSRDLLFYFVREKCDLFDVARCRYS